MIGRMMVARPVLTALLLVTASATQVIAQAPRPGREAPALRCGWFDNPSPGNASLFDKDGEWTIAVQGGRQARGDWPRFKPDQFVRTGRGSYGFGCACFRAEVDADEKDVLTILSSEPSPLKRCRRDPALRRIEKRLGSLPAGSPRTWTPTGDLS